MPQLYPGRRYVRAKAPLQILKGYYPTEPGHLSVTAAPKLDEGIKQGMAIVRVAGEWVKATTAAKTTLATSVFIARHDQDDPAVQASGKLVGLDCSGEFEVQTGYVVAATFAIDSEITVEGGGVTGNFKLAVAGDIVHGKVTATGTGAGGLIAYPGLVLPTTPAADSEMLQFKTVAAYVKPA